MPVYNTKKKKVWNENIKKWEWVLKDSPETTKDGREWYFKTHYENLLGNRKQYKSKKYASMAEAKDEEMIFLTQLTDKIETRTLFFKDVYKNYLDYQTTKIKETSIIAIKNKYKHLEDFDNIQLAKLNINHFNQWKNEIDKKNLSIAYKNNCLKLLKSIIRYGNIYLNIKNDVSNKFTLFKDVNSIKKEMAFFTKEEFDNFIDQEDDLIYKAFFNTLYYCGLRQGECQALTWNDINFDKNELCITKTLTAKIKGKKYVILPPKTKSSNRILPIPKIVLNQLKLVYLNQKKYDNFKNDWFVFGGICPLATTTIQNKKNSNCQKIDKTIRIHDFRHSCASLLINNGANITLVSKYLGHSNIAITLNTYSHMYKSQLDEVIKVIDNLK